MPASASSRSPCTTITARTGQSQFFNFSRIVRTALDVMKLWFALVVRRKATERAPIEDPADPLSRRNPRPVTADYRAFYRGRRVMITGGLGFIGSNLARTLVDLGARGAARRLPDRRLRRRPLQPRRDRRPRAGQYRGRPPGKHHEPSRARPRSDFQPRGPGEPHRQHARSVHRSRHQLP